MELSELGIWNEPDTEPWVRDSASRWSALTIRIVKLYVEIFAASSLPRAETEVLCALLLKEGERAEPSVVARELRVSKQGMTGLVDRLEGAGYVRREAHPSDRRKKIVALTPTGLEEVKRVARSVFGRTARILSGFDRKRTEDTISTMERLCEKAEEWHGANPA